LRIQRALRIGGLRLSIRYDSSLFLFYSVLFSHSISLSDPTSASAVPPSQYPAQNAMVIVIDSVLRYEIAHPLRSPNLHRRRRPTKHTRHGPFHSWHDNVLWQYILACAGSSAVQVFGTGYAVGRVVSDWGVGGVGCEGTAGWDEV
jgi:hypothetical protein